MFLTPPLELRRVGAAAIGGWTFVVSKDGHRLCPTHDLPRKQDDGALKGGQSPIGLALVKSSRQLFTDGTCGRLLIQRE